MRSIGVLAAAIAMIGAPAYATEWSMVPNDSSLTFEVAQGSSSAKGAFERFESEISFDPDALAQSKVAVLVDVASVELGDEMVTTTARGAAWLAADEHGQARYETTAFRPLDEAGRYEVDAQLTLRGVTQQVTHEAVIRVEGDHATATGEVPILRLDYGVGGTADPSGSNVGLEVTVRFDISATRQPKSTASARDPLGAMARNSVGIR